VNTLPHIFVLSSMLKKSNLAIMTGIIQAPHLKPEKRLNKTLFATGLENACGSKQNSDRGVHKHRT